MNGTDRDFKARVFELLLLILAFALLTVLYSYPVILQPVEKTVSLGLNYVLFANSHFIWERIQSFEFPLEIERLFYPTSYTIHEGLFPSLMHLFFGGVYFPILALNLSILFSFVMAGLGAYILCLHLTGSRFASFVGGILYAFCPQHLANVGTYPILHIEWIPWFMFGLLRFSHSHNWVWLLLIQITFILASLSSWYFAVFLLLCTGLWSLFRVLSVRSLVLLGLSFFLSGVLLLPFTPSLLLGQLGTATGGLNFFIVSSADLVSYFIPAWHHWYFGDPIRLIQQDWQGDPSLRANYLGYVPLALALVCFLLARRGKVQYFFLALAGSSFVLSLGPYLTIMGESGWMVLGPDSVIRIPLPYLWLSDIFPFSATRAVSRYSVLVSLSIAVLSAFGVANIQRRIFRRPIGNIASALLLLLLFVEFWPGWPDQTKGVVPPSPVYEVLARSDSGTLMELPLKNNAYRIPYLARFHNRNIIGGAVDKPYLRFVTRLRRIPFFRRLTFLGTPHASSRRLHDILVEADYDVDVVSAFDVQSVVLHKWDQFILSFGDYFVQEPLFEDYRIYLDSVFVKMWEDDHVLALRPKEVTDEWLFPEIGETWGSVEEHTDYLTRPLLGDEGSLLLHSGNHQPVDISFEISTIYVAERDLEITLNQKPILQSHLKARVEHKEWQELRFERLALAPGVNELILSTGEPLTSGEETYRNGDTRKISFLIRNLSLRRPSE